MNDKLAIKAAFEEKTGILVKNTITGSKLSTMSVGGLIDHFVTIENIEDLTKALSFFFSEGVKYKVVAGGSNVIFPDKISDTWILKLGQGFRTKEVISENKEGVILKIGSAIPLIGLSSEYSKKNFSGLEFAGGIPAAIGGALKMNAGAHGSDMSQIVEEVYFVNTAGNVEVFKKEDCGFAYRQSSFPGGSVITGCKMRLKKCQEGEAISKRSYFLAERKKNQPITIPSSGSIFKNPTPQLSAGVLLDSLGLKDFKCGQAQISGMHANWIVNPNRLATSSEVLQIIEKCKKKALKEEGIALKTEVKLF